MGRWYIGGLLKHARAVLAFAAPTTNSYKRLVPGYEAPVNLVYSQRNRSAACRIPLYSQSPKAKRVEFRCPDPSCNPYLAFSAMLMAGLDGVQNRIEPPDPVDKDLYDLPPEELAKVPQVPGSLDEALARARGRPRLPEGRRCLHRRPASRPGSTTSGSTRSTPSGCGPTRGSSCSTTTSSGDERLGAGGAPRPGSRHSGRVRRPRPMRPRHRAVWQGARMAAPAYPVRCTPGDNLAIHVAVTTAPPGAALVVDVGDEDEFGYWGEVLTTAAEARGVAGSSSTAACATSPPWRRHGFPVFSHHRGAARRGQGGAGNGGRARYRWAASTVRRGDWVVGDADGVAVVPGDASRRCWWPAGPAPTRRSHSSPPCGPGPTTVELLGLDPSPVVGSPLASVTRLGRRYPVSTSHTWAHASLAIRARVARVALPMWGSSTVRGARRASGGGRRARRS